jgi:hypothetical protein
LTQIIYLYVLFIARRLLSCCWSKWDRKKTTSPAHLSHNWPILRHRPLENRLSSIASFENNDSYRIVDGQKKAIGCHKPCCCPSIGRRNHSTLIRRFWLGTKVEQTETLSA